MEARIVQLPTPAEVSVEPDRIVIDRLVVRDPALASILGERAPEDRPALVERALRIGLLALQDAGATVNVDVVRTEFEKLMRQTEQVTAARPRRWTRRSARTSPMATAACRGRSSGSSATAAHCARS